MGMSAEDVDRLDSIVKRSRPLHRGDHLFRSGERFRSLYVVKTGSVKTYTPSEEGGEQVLGFHLPGEIIGLDAIDQDAHACSAKVLETSAICEVPFQRFEELAAAIPSLQHSMYRLLSKEIGHDAEMLLLLGKKNAEERLAAFLVSMSQRLSKRGLSPTDFYLSMSRHEIGNYLGLFVLAYALVMGEEFTHLRKSKPVVLAAGIIWLLIAYYYTDPSRRPARRRDRGAPQHHGVRRAVPVPARGDDLHQRHGGAARLRGAASLADPQRLRLSQAVLDDRLPGLLHLPGGGQPHHGAADVRRGDGGRRDKPRFVVLGCINIVVAANAGGAFSPFGDITTLMVWQKGIIPFQTFFLLFFPALVNYLVPAYFLHRRCRTKPRRRATRWSRPSAAPSASCCCSCSPSPPR
jgi:CRP/FNR family transcriptional regulator